MAKRLRHAVGDKGFVSRWGGDEFTVIQTNIENRADLTSLLDRIKDVISEPIIITGNTLLITASIGVSLSRKDGNTVEAFLKNADAAIYRAKSQTKN